MDTLNEVRKAARRPSSSGKGGSNPLDDMDGMAMAKRLMRKAQRLKAEMDGTTQGTWRTFVVSVLSCARTIFAQPALIGSSCGSGKVFVHHAAVWRRNRKLTFTRAAPYKLIWNPNMVVVCI